MIQVMQWSTRGSSEPASLYRIDRKSEALRFFADVRNNAELDGREVFEIAEISEEDWKRAEENGRRMA